MRCLGCWRKVRRRRSPQSDFLGIRPDTGYIISVSHIPAAEIAMTKITALIALLAAALLLQSCGGASDAADSGPQRLGASLDPATSIGAEGAQASLSPTATPGSYELTVVGA